MISVLFNVLTVTVVSTLGLLLKKGIPSRITAATMTAIALCTLYIGVDGALTGSNAIVTILAMVLGTALGTLIGEMTCGGNLMIIGLAFNLLGITKLKIADMLPSLLFVVPVYYLVNLIPL